jgi:hypothetical protein
MEMLNEINMDMALMALFMIGAPVVIWKTMVK